MDNRSTDNFWNSLRNITTISKLISEKRDESKNISRPQDKKLLLNFHASRETNMISLINILNNKILANLIIDVFGDMYRFKFEEVSSVQRAFDKNRYSESELDRLEVVNLLYHSFGVVNKMNEIIPPTYNIFRDYFLLAAAAHDMGKCPALRDSYAVSDENGHHKASAEYLMLRYAQIREGFPKEEFDLLQAVCEAIRVQHDTDYIENKNIVQNADREKFLKEQSKTILKDVILEMLKIADSSQKQDEIKLIDMQRKTRSNN